MKVDKEGNIITDEEKCPVCGEIENWHLNREWESPYSINENDVILCNECGTFFKVEKT